MDKPVTRESADRYWHMHVDQVARSLGTDAVSGLAVDEAASRLRSYGPNQLQEKKGRSAFSIFLDQFRNFIVWVLVAAALVSGFLREWIDAAAIIAIVIVNAVLGFIQEFRAEKSLAALKKLSSPTSRVIRGGSRSVVASSGLVPGDLVELEAGDKVPSDARIAWATPNFSVQEASLTGESSPVMKTASALAEPDTPLADRANMVYMGTSVSSGKARAIVVRTGMSTELGRIAGMIQDIEQEATPLQKKLEQFGKWIVYLCFSLVGLVFVLEWLHGLDIADVFLTSVSLAVAAIPEGLPAVVTIALALGVQRMAKRNALIRKLPSVETLGCATVICSDKTGTLTKNEMTVRAVYAGSRLYRVTGIGYEPKGEYLADGEKITPEAHPELMKSLEVGVLCNGAELLADSGRYAIVGDPTEGAILTAAGKLGVDKKTLESAAKFVEEIPFDPERKKMTIVRHTGAGLAAFVKGAPDVLLKDCTEIYSGSLSRRMTKEDASSISKANDELASQAMRVLAVACRRLDKPPETYDACAIEKDLVFVGLIAMIDPPRDEVRCAMAECRTAGIRTVMITGDHKNTAVAIAGELGSFGSESLALTGEELDRLDEAAFMREVDRVGVYARVSPEHKLRIVRTLRGKGEVVAMTGDGVNDAPAVKEADIGVAMGITGTDVTKEVSDMVVTDDNFASIVAAVEEGRGIYDNIKKFVHYLLSCNAGEILVMLAASLANLPVPLLPIQILWVNLVTDGLPALALGVDPVDLKVMSRPPRPTGEAVVTKWRAALILIQGAFIAFCSLLAFCLVLYIEKDSLGRARTAAFIVLSVSQLFHALNCRSFTGSLFSIGVFTNRKLIAANLVSFSLQVAVVYLPFAQKIFKTESLSAHDWALVIAISSFPLWAMEAVKLLNRRYAFLK
jgi:Ca2+-transporting ATPase